MAEFAKPRKPFEPMKDEFAVKSQVFADEIATSSNMAPLPEEEQFNYAPSPDELKTLTGIGVNPLALFDEEEVVEAMPEPVRFEAEQGIGGWNNTESVIYDVDGGEVFESDDEEVSAMMYDERSRTIFRHPDFDEDKWNENFYYDNNGNVHSQSNGKLVLDRRPPLGMWEYAKQEAIALFARPFHGLQQADAHAMDALLDQEHQPSMGDTLGGGEIWTMDSTVGNLADAIGKGVDGGLNLDNFAYGYRTDAGTYEPFYSRWVISALNNDLEEEIHYKRVL